MKLFIFLVFLSLIISASTTATPTAVTQKDTIPATPSDSPVSTDTLARLSTYTPAPQAQCPAANPDLTFDYEIPIPTVTWFPYDDPTTSRDILYFLNHGGTIDSVVLEITSQHHFNYLIEDVTGDTIADFIFADFGIPQRVYVLVCENGQYHKHRTMENPLQYTTEAISIADLNANGIPEILVHSSYGPGAGIASVTISEWDGHEFVLEGCVCNIIGVSDVRVIDVDGNGTLELILKGRMPGAASYVQGYSRRYEIYSYRWDGSTYILASTEFEPPEYHFQAIQNASDRWRP